MKSPEEIRKLAIDGLLSEIAQSDIGIFPEAILGGPHAYKERNNYQDGWNDCYKEHMTKSLKFYQFYTSLDEENKLAFENLLLEEEIQLNLRDEKIIPWVMVSDTFEYACADGEDVDIKDLPLLWHLYEKFTNTGIVAWIAQKRGYEPLEAWINYDREKYEEAVRYLKDLK